MSARCEPVSPLSSRPPSTVAGSALAAATRAQTQPTTNRQPARRPAAVRSGLDMLAAEQFAPLAGKRVGLITNHSGLDGRGRHAVDLLQHTPNVKLVALFSPEHGLYGNVDAKVAIRASIPKRACPFTASTAKHCGRRRKCWRASTHSCSIFRMPACASTPTSPRWPTRWSGAAKAGIDFYVLDRPNPINANRVQGPMLDSNIRSFTALLPAADSLRHDTGRARAAVQQRKSHRRETARHQNGRLSTHAAGTTKPACAG